MEHAAGHGEDALTTLRTRTELEPENSVWQLVTEISKNGIVAARTCAIYQTTDVGDLLLTLAEGYGSPEEQTTQYAYDQCGRLRTETAPDGSQTHDAYDLYGRLLSATNRGRKRQAHHALHVCAFGGGQLQRRTGLGNGRPASAGRTRQNADIHHLEIHDGQPHQKNGTAGHGPGCGGHAPDGGGTMAGRAANIHARGRTRFSRDLDGVQTWHDYAATTEHGALYTETVETRISGEAVPGQSTRAVTWITAEGQRVREENYLLLSTGQWALTGSAVYELTRRTGG